MKGKTQKWSFPYQKILRDTFRKSLEQTKSRRVLCREQRIWIGILNKSLRENIEIKKKSVLGFFVLETKSVIKIKHEMQTKKKQTSPKISKKNTKGQLSKQV